MKRRLAVILMADMVDYSRLMETDQASTIALVQALRERQGTFTVRGHAYRQVWNSQAQFRSDLRIHGRTEQHERADVQIHQ